MTTSILIVEDESIVALDLQFRLNRLGYQVVGIANSGEEALQLAETYQPDLTLMDIRLKGPVDGIDTAQELRKRQDAPIVYLTAYADEATLQRAKQTEPYGYLVKPFEERELHSTVEMAIYKITSERQQKTHAARLQKIMATVPEGVVLLDADQRIVLANVKALEFLLTLANVQIGDVVTHLGPYTIEQLLHFSNDDGWHEFQSTGIPLRIFEVNITRVQTDTAHDPDDVSGEHVLVLRDVTVDREIRDRIQVQDRLAAVGQFAAGIAHDFNNILASIMLQPYIIQRQEGTLRPRSLECLENITQQAERGAELIQQLLDFSRSSALEMHPFDLVPLLKELTKMLERLLPANIDLQLSIASDEYKVKGDPTRTLQLLMNLASNARDAMPNGGELQIDLTRTTGDNLDANSLGDWVRIQVRDTGSGIHPEILPHIFEPFFTTKAAGKGTGLGLAQVYGIVQQHGGQINIHSQLGQGTTFSIYLPALNDDTYSDLHASDEPGMLPTGQKELILLVEDNTAIGNSLSEVLQLSNYRVLTTDNGHAALEMIEQVDTPINLIISDLAMPDMGGLELCQELRRRQLNIPVLILSGYVSEATLTELRVLGVVDYLAKPVDIEILLGQVHEALRAQPPA